MCVGVCRRRRKIKSEIKLNKKKRQEEVPFEGKKREEKNKPKIYKGKKHSNLTSVLSRDKMFIYQNGRKNNLPPYYLALTG